MSLFASTFFRALMVRLLFEYSAPRCLRLSIWAAARSSRWGGRMLERNLDICGFGFDGAVFDPVVEPFRADSEALGLADSGVL